MTQLYIISSSGTTDCMKGIHSVVQNVYNRRGFLYIPYSSVLCVNFAICCIFCLLAYWPIQQLGDIYSVVLQISHRLIHCRCIRVWGSVRHINVRCKQIIDGCKI
jgi:hypothetical protein